VRREERSGKEKEGPRALGWCSWSTRRRRWEQRLKREESRDGGREGGEEGGRLTLRDDIAKDDDEKRGSEEAHQAARQVCWVARQGREGKRREEKGRGDEKVE